MTSPFDAVQTAARTQSIAADLAAVEWITDGRVERLSQDFYWFSPVLKRQLEGLRADAVARPKTEDEIRAVVAACARQGVPITARGSGTGCNFIYFCLAVFGAVWFLFFTACAGHFEFNAIIIEI